MKAIDWLREKAVECNDATVKCDELGLHSLAKDFSGLEEKINELDRIFAVAHDEVEDGEE